LTIFTKKNVYLKSWIIFLSGKLHLHLNFIRRWNYKKKKK